MTITSKQLNYVTRVPHAFHSSDLIVHENGIVVSSTRTQASDADVDRVAESALRHLDIARQVVLRSAFGQWSLSLWEVIDI